MTIIDRLNALEATPPDDGWGPLEPFESEPHARFPLATLPPRVRHHVSAVASDLGVAPEMPAIISLGVLAASIAPKYVIEARPGWHEIPTFFILGIAESGEMKSHVITRLAAPIKAYEAKLTKDYLPILANARAAREAFEAKVENAKRVLRSAKGTASEGGEEALAALYLEEGKLMAVVSPRITIDDITPESFADRLSQHPALFNIDAEGTFVESACNGRYSDGDARIEPILKSYDGDSIKVDRMQRQVRVERAIFTCSSLVQPDVWAALTRNHKLEQRGLIPRFLVAGIPSLIGRRHLRVRPTPQEVDEAALDFDALVQGLCAHREPRLDRELSVLTVYLDDEAAKMFSTFDDAYEERLLDESTLAAVPAWAKKQRGAVLRLACILHAASCEADDFDTIASTPISAETLKNAIAIGQYFEANKLALLPSAQKKRVTSHAEIIALWLGRREVKDRFLDVRTIQRHVKRLLAKNIRATLPELEARGYVRRAPDGRIEVRPDFCADRPPANGQEE